MSSPRGARIAVIGCGIFGALAALKLRQAGLEVTIYERLPRPLGGASLNNQNRLHLGFHYPRDMETARQCVAGFDRFVAAFPECIRGGFPNGYFVAREGSLTSAGDYLDFCRSLGVSFREIAPEAFPLRVDNVSMGVLCEEVVYDSRLLGGRLAEELARSDVDLRLGHEVVAVGNDGGSLSLTLQGGARVSYDGVVNATYANVNRFTRSLGHPVAERLYEYTVVPIIEAPFERTGVTVMDGGFMTVLPYGLSEMHLLYHVDHTVIAAETRELVDPAWLDHGTSPFAALDGEAFFRTMIEACSYFVPSLRGAQLRGFLHGPRMVLARRDDTDPRPSIMEAVQDNYVTIFSGKIDHSVWVADAVVDHFLGRGRTLAPA